MAHDDALQNNPTQIIDKIKKHFDINKLKSNVTAYIIKGAWCFDNKSFIIQNQFHPVQSRNMTKKS